MSDNPDQNTADPARGLTAMLQHLRRSGIQFLPAANPDSVQQWSREIAPATTIATHPAIAERLPGPITEPSRSAGLSRSPALPPAVAAGPSRSAAPFGAAASPPSPMHAKPAAPVRPVGAAPAKAYETAKLPIAERSAQLAELAGEISGCPRCEILACSRTQTVPGEGNPAARVCFLGEAPGADEDASGRPFVGRAGQLLTKMIEACTFTREDVFILNTIKCRPPGNRNPEPDEVENCRPYLERQLEIIQPEYIVCLGLVAAQAILHTKLSVGRLRGQFHEYRGSKVLVTYHPSYLLREPAVKKAAWADLQFLLRDMGIQIPKP